MLGAFCGLAAASSGAQPTLLCSFDEEMWEIEVQGVFVRAITTGHIERKLAWQALEFERDIQAGALIKVGLNKYAEKEGVEVELHE